MSIALKLGLGLLALLILVVTAMWVIGLGPFNTRPSVAARAIPKVQAAVAKTQGQAGAAVAVAETKTQAAADATQKRTETHVAKIRAAAPRVAPADVPDGEFYRGVCDSQLYQGSADCSGVGGQPEGGHPADRPRAVRGR